MSDSRHETWGIALFFVYMALVVIVPDTSPWYGLVFAIPVIVVAGVVVRMAVGALGRRRSARVLAREPALRALHGDERRALQWFGEPERIHWRMPRGNVVDLHAAIRQAGHTPVVRSLEGHYRRLAWRTHHNVHDLIGDVEVLLLPGADRALQAHNRAEVLVCGDIAVVLALNARWKVHHARGLLR